MSVHINSVVSYHDQIKTFGKRRKLIYGHMIMENRPLTVREIKDALFDKSGDMNSVAPRVTKLIQEGWAVEVGKVKDPMTGRLVKRVRGLSIAERQQQDAGAPVQHTFL